ncbi:MAG: hypothetical protein AAGD28_28335 [Bacteroidota bacterium]
MKDLIAKLDTMKRRAIFFAAILMSFILGQAQESNFVPEQSVAFKKKEGKILLKQCSRPSPARTITGYFDLDEEDILSLEQNFRKLLTLSCNCPYEKISDLESYGYQYLGVKRGTRNYIYINAVHMGMLRGNDKIQSPIRICDGGRSAWGVLYDLEREDFFELAINGF